MRHKAPPPERDARGIVAPDRGLQRFDLQRVDPSAAVARFVAWYWIVTWDLDEPYEQPVLAHPVVNVVFGDGPATVYGPPTRINSRTLVGQGRVLGVMFRPAGYRPLLGAPMRKVVDRQIPYQRDLPPDPEVVDQHLSSIVPVEPQPSENTTRLVERIAADPTMVRVSALADEVGLSERQLQRRFADHVGLSPKSVVRRYRLYEAAERARSGPVDWAALAAELGYSDQAHLTRDFTAALGMSPARYAAVAATSTGRAQS
jgi:AraC-like DNA-binding protein